MRRQDRLGKPTGDSTGRVVVHALNGVEHQARQRGLGLLIAAELQKHKEAALGNGLGRGGHRLDRADVQRPGLAMAVDDVEAINGGL